MPALLRDSASDFILASHTGSGKTLAYLLPIGARSATPGALQGFHSSLFWAGRAETARPCSQSGSAQAGTLAVGTEGGGQAAAA